MIDFDKMTKEEHEEYREMQRKAEAFDVVDERLYELVELYRNKAFQEELHGFKGAHDEQKSIADKIENVRISGLKKAMDLED